MTDTEKDAELRRLRRQVADWKRRYEAAFAYGERAHKELAQWRGYEPGRWYEVARLDQSAVPVLQPLLKAASTCELLVTVQLDGGAVSVRAGRKP